MPVVGSIACFIAQLITAEQGQDREQCQTEIEREQGRLSWKHSFTCRKYCSQRCQNVGVGRSFEHFRTGHPSANNALHLPDGKIVHQEAVVL